MATVENYSRIIRELLSKYAEVPYLNKGLEKETLFGDHSGRYMIVSLGWQNEKRVHHCVIHLDIIGDKVWVQKDNTDVAIARELERAGIPKSAIVLGFYHPSKQPDTEYAVA